MFYIETHRFSGEICFGNWKLIEERYFLMYEGFHMIKAERTHNDFSSVVFSSFTNSSAFAGTPIEISSMIFFIMFVLNLIKQT